MKVTFAGKLDVLVPAHREKVERKLAKLGKLLDGRQEYSAHVILDQERQLHRAEITLHMHDHDLVATGEAPDLLTAVSSAIERLERQVLKLREKWRDSKRGPEKSVRIYTAQQLMPEEEGSAVEEDEYAIAELADGRQVKIFWANHRAEQKPLTLEEAVYAVEEEGLDYLIYRDASTDRLCVLVRRRDGHLDLVEA